MLLLVTTIVIMDISFIIWGIKMIKKADRLKNLPIENYPKNLRLTPRGLKFNGIMMIFWTIMATLAVIIIDCF